MNSKPDILKDAPQEIMTTQARLTLLWDENHHNDDLNWLIHGEDIEMVYGDKDKARVTDSIVALANNAYITVDNPLLKMQPYSQQQSNHDFQNPYFRFMYSIKSPETKKKIPVKINYLFKYRPIFFNKFLIPAFSVQYDFLIRSNFV